LNDTKVEVSASWFKKGESVEVLEGELHGMVGEVTAIEGELITVQTKDGKKIFTSKFSPTELKKHFEEGNHVKVVDGRYTGESGLLVKIEGNIMTLVLDSTQKEIEVFSRDIQKADDRSVGVSSLGNFFLHDFVNLE